MGRFFRNNGLSVVFLALFLIFLSAHTITGWFSNNADRKEDSEPSLSLVQYMASGDYIESVGENWESEFLQMGMFVILTVKLYQKGSPESKDPDKKEEVDREIDPKRFENVPHPVRVNGFLLKLYKNSLSLMFLFLFLCSVAVHAVGGAMAFSEEQIKHGKPPVSTLEYMTTSRFWFESFQNWQSEFLAVFAIVFLGIYLRQHGSPESKPVDAPNSETG
jgi:hypothetical protein